MHVMNKHVIVCLVNASSFGGEVFLRVSRQVRYLENSLLDRALLYLLSQKSIDVPWSGPKRQNSPEKGRARSRRGAGGRQTLPTP